MKHRRLFNQHITHTRFNTLAEIVRWMGAMQAQDYHQAVWALGARLPHSTIQDIENALSNADIIRTWPMRGTIHFVSPSDARWMLQLGATRMIAKDQTRQKQLELDTDILGRCEDVLREALDGRKIMSRPDVLQTLENAGISTASQRGYHILWYLAQKGVLCIGPTIEKEQTFTLLEQWVHEHRHLNRDEALVELATRYFISHGPATQQDFVWWAGLTVGDAKQAIEGAKPKLVSETIDKKVYWWGSDAPTKPIPQDSAVLLAGYDEYLLGYTDRTAVLDPQFSNQVCPGGNGVFAPMLVLDGQIVGTWRRTFKKNAVQISFALFMPMSASDTTRLETAAQRYGEFWGLPAVLV
jgi:hypothetical protein